MSKYVLILSAIAMIVSVTICVSHVAHAGIDTATEISISMDADSSDDISQVGDGCDMSCGGCCIHHAIAYSSGDALATAGKRKLLMAETTLFVSDFNYGLKRPPRY